MVDASNVAAAGQVVVVLSWLAVRLEVLEVILGAEIRAGRLVARYDLMAVVVCKSIATCSHYRARKLKN
jgi:hypothetical protein